MLSTGALILQYATMQFVCVKMLHSEEQSVEHVLSM